MKNLLLLFLLFTTSLLSQAQQEQIRFKHISLKQGLSQSTVKCSFKDSEGYMWFGTRDGLNRYDGYQMTVYRTDPQKPGSISSNFVNNILEDKAGNLWVATTQGIDRFDRQQETFLHYSLGKHLVDVIDILQDRQGNLWLGTSEGLYRFDKGRFSLYSTLSGIRQLAQDDQEELWVITWRNIRRFNLRSQHFSDYPCKPNEPDLSIVYQDHQGHLWVGSIGGGLLLYNRQNDSFTHFVHQENNPNSLCHDEVLSLAEGPDGRLWIGTQNGGISLFDYRKNLFSTLRQDIDDPSSLSNNSVHSLYQDDQGNMWAGTWAGGLNFFSRYADKFVHYQKILHFNNPNMYAIAGDQQGRIWIGVEDGGLVLFDRHSGQFTHYPNQHHWEFLTNVIFSIIDYSQDSLAIGYHRGSFAFFNKRNGRFSHFFPNPDHLGYPQPQKPGNIWGSTKPIVLRDHDHNLWIGDWGSGLNFYDKRTQRFTNYRFDPKDPASLSNNAVFALCEDRQGDLWVGTEQGLNRFDRRSGRFVRYLHEANNQHSLSHDVVNALLEDHQGNLWIGTAEGGLNRLDQKTNRFIHYGRQEGLPSDVIKGMLEDDKGNLWLSTNKGISRFNLQRKTFRNYDTNDGLQVEEFNRNACYRAPDGTLFFAGTTGINLFHPDSLRVNPYIPPVVITDFQIFNKSVGLAEKDSPLRKSINQTKELTLSYRQSVFTFEFAALNFTLPGKNQYAYQLEGFDQGWNYVGTQRKATYTNLNPGAYTFRVKASNNDGIWNEKGTSLKIIITPPFWQTWWFRIGVAIAILGSAFTFYQIRINAIQAQKAKLKRQVDEKTSELLAINEEISTQNEVVMEKNQEIEKQAKALEESNFTKDKLFSIISHDLRGPLGQLQEVLNLLELDYLSQEEFKMLTPKLKESVGYTLRLTDNLLYWAKSQMEGVQIHPTRFDLREIAEENFQLLKPQADRKSIHLINSVNTSLWANADKDMIKLVLRNLINNAVKFTNNEGTVVIGAEAKPASIVVFVKDTGTGLADDEIARLFTKETFSKYGTSGEKGAGLGLVLCQEFIEKNGGRMMAESELGIGSKFAFSIPLSAKE